MTRARSRSTTRNRLPLPASGAIGCAGCSCPTRLDRAARSVPRMPVPTITLTAIEKSFLGIKPLDKVDFTASGGEIHALLGENGAGKSTLTRIMGGALTPDAGTIEFDGTRVVWQSPRHAKRAGIHIIH